MVDAQFTKENVLSNFLKEKVLIYSHFWTSNIKTVVINFIKLL